MWKASWRCWLSQQKAFSDGALTRKHTCLQPDCAAQAWSSSCWPEWALHYSGESWSCYGMSLTRRVCLPVMHSCCLIGLLRLRTAELLAGFLPLFLLQARQPKSLALCQVFQISKRTSIKWGWCQLVFSFGWDLLVELCCGSPLCCTFNSAVLTDRLTVLKMHACCRRQSHSGGSECAVHVYGRIDSEAHLSAGRCSPDHWLWSGQAARKQFASYQEAQLCPPPV